MDVYTTENKGTRQNTGRLERVTPEAPIRGAEFYHTHREVNRTMRMDTGGLCQFCARKAEQRVELYSPLWQAGPIMYGECCLPQAEAALRMTSHAVAPPPLPRKPAERRRPQGFWLKAAVAALAGFLVLGAERILQVKVF